MRHAYTPTLPELQAFVQSARTGTTTRAALALGLTQSAVSRALGTLEARLGVRLFHRDRQRLSLSDAGRAFLPDAEALLAGLDAAAMAVMSFAGHRDVLRVAALPTFAAHWLIPRLGRFAAEAPDVLVDVSATLDPVAFDRDPRDCAVLRADGPAGAAHVEVLAQESLVVVARPELVAANRLLEDLPLLQQSTRPTLWLDWCAAAGRDAGRFRRGPRFEQFAMVLAAARAGLGLALVPDILVADDIAEGRLAVASDRRLATATPYVLAWPDRSTGLPAFGAFHAWLSAEAAPAAPPPAPQESR